MLLLFARSYSFTVTLTTASHSPSNRDFSARRRFNARHLTDDNDTTRTTSTTADGTRQAISNDYCYTPEFLSRLSVLARHMVYRYANKWHRAHAFKKHTIRLRYAANDDACYEPLSAQSNHDRACIYEPPVRRTCSLRRKTTFCERGGFSYSPAFYHAAIATAICIANTNTQSHPS